MKRHVAMVFAGLLLAGGTAAGQQPQPAPAPAAPRAPAPPLPPAIPRPAAAKAPSAPVPLADSSTAGQIVNIRLEVSITDQTGSATVQPKMLTLLLADRNSSQ